MSDFVPTFFYLNIPFFVLLLLAIVAGIYSYFYYKKTIPPVSQRLRYFLGISRGITTFLILILLFTPQLKLEWQYQENPKIIIATDKSASMQIVDQQIPRFEQAKLIQEYLDSELGSTNKIFNYYFDLDTIAKIDSINVGKLGTNISNVLINLSNKYNSAESIVLISDGVITEGSNPLFSDYFKKFQIFTIGIGDTVDVPDILIKNVKVNKTVYKNNSTKVSAEITTQNQNNIETTVTLATGNKIIAAKKIKIQHSGQIQQVDFEITPNRIGTVKYQVQISGFEGEKIKENNSFPFQIEVLKEKLTIGLLASKPSYDTKFLIQNLTAEKSFNLLTYFDYKKNNNISIVQNIIDSSDVLILFDFPTRAASNNLKNYLMNSIETKRIPACFFASTAPDQFYLNILRKRFPELTLTPGQNTYNLFAKPTIKGELNPVFNLYDNSELNRAFWDNCAPIEYAFRNINIAKTDKIFLQSSNNEKLPVLVSNQFKGIKNLIFLGKGFWRWNFLLAEDNQFSSGYSTLVHNTFKWISKNPANQNINIELNENSVSLGEQVNASVQVYNASFNPVSDAEIKLKILGPAGNFESTAQNLGDGIYTWQYVPMMEGNYSIQATAYKNDVQLGENQIEFEVTPVNNEFLFSKQDAEFLKNLAASTGGKYYSWDNYKEIIQYIPKTTRTIKKAETYNLWNKLYTLLIIIFLLTIEWFIRKRKGLA